MSKTLVVVESATKAVKIQGYLGPSYIVLASKGHILTLGKDKSDLGIDIADLRFEPRYYNNPKNYREIKAIQYAFKGCSNLICAGDHDREGAFINWSVAKLLNKSTPQCMIFNEITPKAIKVAVSNLVPLDAKLVEAAQTRQMLDKLIGYKISPTLWGSIHKNAGCGRVQTPALRLICDREKDIAEFDFDSHKEFKFTLIDTIDTTFKAKSFTDPLRILEAAKHTSFVVNSVVKKQSTESPPQPFITSTYQQTSNLTPKDAMNIAQQLYEAGKITYMRTDSHLLCEEFTTQMSKFITTTYGVRYVGPQRVVKNSAKAQEAHEAIRPTDVTVRTLPEDEDWSPLCRRIYEMIWKRTVAWGMQNAIYDVEQVTTVLDLIPFVASSKVLTFPGFKCLYDKESDELVSKYTIGAPITLKTLRAEQCITNFPHRYTQASLINELEKRGIGRPSTFEAITTKIITKGYIKCGDVRGRECDLVTHTLAAGVITTATKKEQFGFDSGKLFPSENGVKLLQIVTDSFPFVPDYAYTAIMEDRLDKVAAGVEPGQSLLRDLFRTLAPCIDAIVAKQEPTVVKDGKFGPYIRANGKNIAIKPPFYVDDLTPAEISFISSLPLQYSDEETLCVGPRGFYITWRTGKYSCTMTKDEMLKLTQWKEELPQFELVLPS